MKAIVLSGGFATRLRPISYALPKLLFPIAGKPMIYWTLDLLQKYGVDHVVLAVNYLADSLQAVIRQRYKSIKISYSLETKPLGTGGPIKLATQKLRPKETFIAMNGDIIAEIALDGMLGHHQETEATVTDALHEVRDPSRFGVVQLDSEWRIQRFVEKPTLEQAPSHLINAGIYMIEPELLDMIPPERKVSLEREIFPILVKKGKLFGFPFKGRWFDIGDLSDYRKANFELLKKYESKASQARGSSRFKNPVFIGTRTQIMAGAQVGPMVAMGRQCVVGRGAKVSGSILFDGVTVGENAIVSGAILASNVSLGKNVRIGRGAVVSPNVKVNDGIRIGGNAMIHPHKEITSNVPSGAHIM